MKIALTVEIVTEKVHNTGITAKTAAAGMAAIREGSK